MPGMPPSQRYLVNVSAVTPQQFRYTTLYWSLIEHLIQEHNERLLTHHDRFLGQYLIPTQLGTLNVDAMDKTYNVYKSGLSVNMY